MRRGAIVAVLMVAGCGGGELDPCAGMGVACLSVHVSGSGSITKIDQLGLRLSGVATLDTRTPQAAGAAIPLPVAVAVNLPAGRAGALTVHATGWLANADVGEAEGSITLIPDTHQILRLVLGAAGPVDLSVASDASVPRDQSVGMNDLSNVADLAPTGDLSLADLKVPPDLSMPDLKPPADLAPPADLKPPADLAIPPDLKPPADLAPPADLLPVMVTFAMPATYAVGMGPWGMVQGEVNQDGRLDLIVGHPTPNMQVAILNGNANGSFQVAKFLVAGNTPVWPAVGDFNADARNDIAVCNFQPGSAGAFLSIGGGNFAAMANLPSPAMPYHIIAVDLNGDGRLDLVQTHSAGSASSLPGLANGTFGGSNAYPVGGTPWGIAAGDLNGDGRPDLVTGNSASNNVSVLINQGTFNFAPMVNVVVGTQPHGVNLVDVNGDGRLDLLVANAMSNNVGVLLGLGNGTFAPLQVFAVGMQPWYLATGDFDRDGRVDIVAGNGAAATVSVLMGNGNGTFDAALTFPSGGTGPRGITVGDYNGDGKADIAVANSMSGNVGVLLNTSP